MKSPHGKTFTPIDPKSAEKLISEVLFCIWALQVPENWASWLHATAKNTVLDASRQLPIRCLTVNTLWKLYHCTRPRSFATETQTVQQTGNLTKQSVTQGNTTEVNRTVNFKDEPRTVIDFGRTNVSDVSDVSDLVSRFIKCFQECVSRSFLRVLSQHSGGRPPVR